MPYKNMAWIRNPNCCFIKFGDVFVIYSIPNISIVETSCYEQTLPLPYPGKMFITGHGIFPEKIALLKQLSGVLIA